MWAETADAHHDDGLDIDLGIGFTYDLEQGSKDTKIMLNDSVRLLQPRNAASEIGYESDCDDQADTNLDNHVSNEQIGQFTGNDTNEDFGVGSHAPVPNEGHILVTKFNSNQDEINWEDAEDEGSDFKKYEPTTSSGADGTQCIVKCMSLNMQAEHSSACPEGQEDQSTFHYNSDDLEYNVQENSNVPMVAQGLDSDNNQNDSSKRQDPGGAYTYQDQDDHSENDGRNLVKPEDSADLGTVNVGGYDIEIENFEQTIPEIEVLFANNHYSLFRDCNDPDRPYILEDSLYQARVSELLDALQNTLGEELNDGDELVVRVEDLCLEISAVIASSLQSMTIMDFVHLYNKLIWNEDSLEYSSPLRLTILVRPAFTYRYQELLAGIRQGFGLSQLRRSFDTGNGVVYASPVHREDLEYPVIGDGAEYGQSAEDQNASNYISTNISVADMDSDNGLDNEVTGAVVTSHTSEGGDNFAHSIMSSGTKQLSGSYKPENKQNCKRKIDFMEQIEERRIDVAEIVETKSTSRKSSLDWKEPELFRTDHSGPTEAEPDWAVQQNSPAYQEPAKRKVSQTTLESSNAETERRDRMNTLASNIDISTPTTDEISWEVEDDIGRSLATHDQVPVAVASGKRQYPDGNADEQTGDVKRCRSL